MGLDPIQTSLFSSYNLLRFISRRKLWKQAKRQDKHCSGHWSGYQFLDASSHFCKGVCPSVCPSVRMSVTIKGKPLEDASYCPPGLVMINI